MDYTNCHLLFKVLEPTLRVKESLDVLRHAAANVHSCQSPDPGAYIIVRTLADPSDLAEWPFAVSTAAKSNALPMHVTIRSSCPDSPIYREPVFSARYNRVLLQFRIQAFNETANFVESAPALILTGLWTRIEQEPLP